MSKGWLASDGVNSIANPHSFLHAELLPCSRPVLSGEHIRACDFFCKCETQAATTFKGVLDDVSMIIPGGVINSVISLFHL